MWQALIADLQQGLCKVEIAARFHVGLARSIVQMTDVLYHHHPFTHVALTGGVFQNLVLQQQVTQHLTAMGFTVLSHHIVPPNDGGLSLGQAAIAAARAIFPQK